MNTKTKTLNRKWEIIYDEEIFDEAGENFIGIISNGDGYLFFHAFMVDEDDELETCIVYNSLNGLYSNDEGAEECRFPWTTENNEKMLDALNNIPDGQSYCGEGGVLQFLKFNTAEN